MEKNNKTESKIVQTYAEDMAKVIEDDRSGLIRKIIHEQEEYEKEKKNISPESKKNKLFLFLGFLFIIISFATLSFFLSKKDVPTVAVEKQFTPLVFLDQNSFLEIKGFDKEKIIQTILNQTITTSVKNGGVEGIYLSSDKKIIGLRKFLQLVKASFVPDIPYNGNYLINDNFLMGVVNTETQSAEAKSGDFFILLKVRSIADVFQTIRAWEGKMFSDFHEFFGFDITSETKYLLTKEWEDSIVKNKNARILYEQDGEGNTKIVMMYILADDNSIIITNTEEAGGEIMLRLATSQIKK